MKIPLIDIRTIPKFAKHTYNLCYRIPMPKNKNDFLSWIKSFEDEVLEFRGKSMVKLIYNPIIVTPTIAAVPFFLKKDLELYFPQHTFTMPTPSKPRTTPYDFATEIWQSKQNLIDDAYTKLTEDRGVTILLDTGKGKTVILSKIIAMMQLENVVIFAGNKLLADQMRDDVSQHLATENILMIGGSATPTEKKIVKELEWVDMKKYPVTIAIIKSAVNILKKNPGFWDQYGLAIYDECHKFCAEESKLLLFQVMTEYKLSLSATVQKKWNHKMIFHSSGNMINGNTYIKSKPMEGIVHLIRYHGRPEYTQQLKNSIDLTCVSAMSRQFSSDPHRTELIMKYILALLARDHNIFVFANVNDMIDNLYEQFSLICPPDIIIGKINNSTGTLEDEITKRDANVIFINYSSGSEGMNIPRMTAVIFASSFRTNGVQIAGRILRESYKTDKVRELVDIVDTNTSIKSQLVDRIKVWRDKGFTINNIKHVA